MKNYRRVFRSALLVAACVLCLLCASTMLTLNESFASGTAEVACSPYTICGLFDIGNGDILFFGLCNLWFTGCICLGQYVEDGKPVGDVTHYETDFCEIE